MKTLKHKNIETKKHQKLPKSIRKYIRMEKSRIRKEISIEKQSELIKQLYLKFGVKK